MVEPVKPCDGFSSTLVHVSKTILEYNTLTLPAVFIFRWGQCITGVTILELLPTLSGVVGCKLSQADVGKGVWSCSIPVDQTSFENIFRLTGESMPSIWLMGFKRDTHSSFEAVLMKMTFLLSCLRGSERIL